MTNRKKIIFTILLVGLAVYFIWRFFFLSFFDMDYGFDYCYFKDIKLNSKIIEVGHNKGTFIKIDGLDGLHNIYGYFKDCQNCPKNEYTPYEVGDTIVKESNSLEFTIKRRNIVTHYLLPDINCK